MKIVLQTIKQVKYEVDIQNESTVLDFKKLIEVKHGFDHNVLKLLHKGKILEDQRNLNEYPLSDGTPVIIMNVKAKAQNINVQNINPEVKEENKKDENNSIKPNIQSNASNNKTASNTKDYSPELKTLQEMGFDKEQSEAALKAANGNLTIAIEFLYSGNALIGNGEEEDEEYVLGPEDEEGEDDEDDIMGEDMDSYEIEDIASVIKVISQSDPTQLQFILANVASHNPELFELIRENEQEFKVLVAQPITPKDQEVYENFLKKNGGSLYGFTGSAGTNPSLNIATNSNNPTNLNSNNTNNLNSNLTEKDLEAIQRLKSLGFSEEECIEAYVVCGKDENLAASFLFENKY